MTEGDGGATATDRGEVTPPGAAKECACCKTTQAAGWYGGPHGKKRKGTLQQESYGTPAWCCNKRGCKRACGFLAEQAPAKAAVLEPMTSSDTEHLSELLSIRGTRCAPAPLPSLPSLPCALPYLAPRQPEPRRRLTIRVVCTQVLRTLKNGYAR